jgi:HEAT repeat protein
VAAVEVLAAFADEASLAALHAAARGDDPDLRRAALLGLGQAGRPASISILLEAARSPDVATRVVALSALAASGSPGGLSTLTAAVGDPDESVRAAAIACLAALPEESAAAALIRQLGTARPEDRERILGHLATPSPARVAAIVHCLEEGLAEDHVAALISALVRMRVPEARAALLGLLQRGEPAVRRAAASALAAVRTGEALRALQRAADEDSDADVRRVCSLLIAR